MSTFILTKKQFLAHLDEGLEDSDVICLSRDLAGSMSADKKCVKVMFGFSPDVFGVDRGIGHIMRDDTRPVSFLVTSEKELSDNGKELFMQAKIKTENMPVKKSKKAAKKKAPKTRKSTTKRGRKQDRARVAGKQKHEVATVAKKTKKSAKRVREAVKNVGHNRKDVEEALREP